MTDTSTFVLVPGAGHGGWAWSPVARHLRAAGRDAVTLTVPGLCDGDDPSGLTLADAVDHVVDEVVRRDLDDITLVAHSWGGYPVTGAAHRLADRVSKIIYHTAFVPARGVALVDEYDDEVAATIRADIASSPQGASSFARELVPLMVPGEPASTCDLLFELLQPTPGRYYTDALDVPDVTTLGVPVAYLLSEDENFYIMPSGAAFAARLGLSPTMVPGGHDSMLTHADAIARAILQA